MQSDLHTDMNKMIPAETEYADDQLWSPQTVTTTNQTNLETYNLHVNEAKTKWVELPSSHSTDEVWRKNGFTFGRPTGCI